MVYKLVRVKNFLYSLKNTSMPPITLRNLNMFVLVIIQFDQITNDINNDIPIKFHEKTSSTQRE